MESSINNTCGYGYIEVERIVNGKGTINIKTIEGDPDNPTTKVWRYTHESAVLLANQILLETFMGKVDEEMGKHYGEHMRRVDKLYNYVFNGYLPEGAEEPYLKPIKPKSLDVELEDKDFLTDVTKKENK